MAKIVSETVLVTFSRLVRDDAEDVAQLVDEDKIALVDATLQEILGEDPSVVIEVEKSDG